MSQCRLCSTRDPQNKFEILSVGTLNNQILELFGFKVEDTDLIKSVCISCERNVQDFHKFYRLVKQTQENLANSIRVDSVATDSQACNFDERDSDVNESIIKHEATDVCLEDENTNHSLDVLLGKSKILPYKNTDKVPTNNNSNSNKEWVTENKIISNDKGDLNNTTKSIKKLKNSDKLQQDENDFPRELIKNGKLIMKGSRLTNLINKFYNIHCELCLSIKCFKKLNEMMKHYKDKHDQAGYVTCCSTRIYKHRAMYLHMAKHLQPSAFECPVCKTSVSRPHILKLHMQTHLPEAEKLYKCDLCNRRFGYSEGLRQHKLSHHIPVENRQTYNCDKCDKSFSLFSSFNSHIKTAHSGTEILCSECGKCFKRNTEYKIHALIHDPLGKNRKQCQHCGFVCKNRVTLKIHMKRHDPGPLLECNECEYKTHRKYSLQRHIHITHSLIKPFQCIVCQIHFKTKTHLSNHMRRHTDPKISCPSCAKIFTSNAGFLKHRKKVHNNLLIQS